MIALDLTFLEKTTMEARNDTSEIKGRAIRMLIQSATNHPSLSISTAVQIISA